MFYRLLFGSVGLHTTADTDNIIKSLFGSISIADYDFCISGQALARPN